MLTRDGDRSAPRTVTVSAVSGDLVDGCVAIEPSRQQRARSSMSS
ncbi:hypothetical protein [Baaleninema simplex]|nr:hypothetical protein [Baaleninema simplex]